MTAPASTEAPLDWCRSRLLVPGHPLSLTLPYAEPGERDRLLALHALISEIASVPGSVSDAEVARRKLGWWREAFAERLPHPAIRAWEQSGLAGALPAAAFDPLIDAVTADVAAPRFEREEDFDRHCRQLAGAGAWLEALMMGAQVSNHELQRRLGRIAGAAYRIRVARDLVLDARAERWNVPLELQAEYRITRDEVARGQGGYRFDALVRHLAGTAVLRMDEAGAELPGTEAWRHRHLLLRQYLDRRLGRRLVRRPARVASERMASGRIGDALALWRQARRLRRAGRR